MSRRGCSRGMAEEKAIEIRPPEHVRTVPAATPREDEPPVEDGFADAVGRLVSAVRRGLARREERALRRGRERAWVGCRHRHLRAASVCRRDRVIAELMGEFAGTQDGDAREAHRVARQAAAAGRGAPNDPKIVALRNPDDADAACMRLRRAAFQGARGALARPASPPGGSADDT